jgi:ArsR family transcriptional regulator, arsenate/arsenite/antimonite-responsive transcriptional repressor / arsenate reductase (thioredoxin)
MFAQTAPPTLLKLLAHDLRWQLVTLLARSDYRVQELVGMLGEPANLVSYHLKKLKSSDLVTERRSSQDGRDVYYSLNLSLLRARYFADGAQIHPAMNVTASLSKEASNMVDMPPVRVLFVCTHNSARSQMAEGLLRSLGGARVEVFSAGTEPATVHPDAVRALADRNIDISDHYSKHVDEFRGQSFDYVITVCDRARESCPSFPDNPEQMHWSFPDPAALTNAQDRYKAFQETAQQLATRIHFLLTMIERERSGQL